MPVVDNYPFLVRDYTDQYMEKSMHDFNGKVVVITGAVGNLGKVVSRRFMAANARTALVDRGEGRLRETFPELLDQDEHLLVDCADLMDEEAVNVSTNEIIGHFGRVDMLVSTVGGFAAGAPLHETPLETWDLMMALNARSVFIASRAMIPFMLEQGGGKIVTMAARPGLAGKAGMAAYSASKAAVIRLTESMSAELKTDNINVNCVIPGTIDTPRNREDSPDVDPSQWVTPDSLADVILFLCSEEARDVHGAVVPVYGRS